MRIALVADTFPPLRTSGAVQLRDLSRELVRQGHQLTVLLPAADLDGLWRLDDWEGVRVLRLHAPKTKDIGYVRRTLNEFWMPFAMRRQLRRSPLAHERFDGVVWYSPSIFHGPLVQALKRQSRCPSYLIIRDIFPEWAVDMGLIGRGVPYKVLDAVARNTASSWTQSGHLKGKVKKLRQPLQPQPVALALAVWLGYASGKRGKALLSTPWASVLDSTTSGLLELAQQAKRRGLLRLSHGAGVVSIDPSGLDPLHGGQQS
jgi:hypothetical protein